MLHSSSVATLAVSASVSSVAWILNPIPVEVKASEWLPWHILGFADPEEEPEVSTARKLGIISILLLPIVILVVALSKLPPPVFQIGNITILYSLVFLTKHPGLDGHSVHHSGTGYNLLDSRLEPIRDYCNFLDQIRLQDESADSFEHYGLYLSKVVILTRHGDRGPCCLKVKDFPALSCDAKYLGPPPRITYVENLAKQLDKDGLRGIGYSGRIPSEYLENFPTDAQCSMGELSEFGVRQHIKLGHMLARLYAKKLTIVPANIGSVVRVLSTGRRHTYQSAISFLHGFFSWLTGATRVSPDWPHFAKYEGAFCGPNKHSQFCPTNCPRLRQLERRKEESILSSSVLQTVEQVRRIISSSVNESVEDLQNRYFVFDGLTAYLCHKHRLPCRGNVCVSVKQIHQIMETYRDSYKQRMNNPIHLELCWIRIYGFLNLLSSILTNQTMASEKLILFSGHYNTIQALAQAFGLQLLFKPPYASRLIFELYRFNESQVFRILYNGEDVTRQTLLCDGHRSEKCLTVGHHTSFVKAESFGEFVRSTFTRLTNTDSYAQACKWR